MKKRLTKVCVTVAAAAITLSLGGCAKLQSRDALNQGVQAYKNQKYSEAVGFFKKAIDLDPEFHTARLYLATAYMSQYIPGAESPENIEFADNAFNNFKTVLDADPKNEVAIASIASLRFNQKKMDEAEEWYKKLIEANPKNKDGYYTLGVIAWTRTFQPRMNARASLGMKPDDPGPIKDKKVRQELREKHMPIIEDGLKSLDEALKIDPEFEDAMAYLNLLNREKADVSETPEEYAKYWKLADEWVEKTMETKKIKAARQPTVGSITTEEAGK